MTITRLRRIAPLQCGIVLCVLYAMIGLIGGLLWVPFATATMGRYPGMPGGAGAAMGAMAIVIFPIVYGAIGFIVGAITALLYNLVAGWTGGIEITLDSTSASGEPVRTPAV